MRFSESLDRQTAKPLTGLSKMEIAQARKLRRLAQIGPKADRGAFWKYCQRTAYSAQSRALEKGFPCSINAYDIDELLVIQQWRCAISGLPLSTPGISSKEQKREPLGPSLDRIIPRLGYVKGNVRVVCTMVNLALNEFGLNAVIMLFDQIYAHSRGDDR